ncbi:hypothetical protein [Flavobacterium aquicola]|uniref:Outer membrane protein with beta-barrel domain n=1 Tax=Flavobacterium aquicola TaxID=1682742 RepID=A0A3E0ERE3_9FLAO|nr:hypothetical protein [Flavobacterium aquicola]REH00354.1 hypothetical protein C8P67_103336 [Flavobacterium aquicola]
MISTLRSFILIIIFTFVFSNPAKGQPRVGNSIKASIGFGLSTSNKMEGYGNQNEVDVDGGGFYAQGEYIFGITKWFGLRPYAGLVITSTDGGNPHNQPNYKVTTEAFLLGGKARICAPIPWIAPFIETGIGTSIGSFQTFTPSINYKKNTALLHIPLSFGLLLGPKHNIEIAATYYFTPAANQVSGALAAGFSFPID